MKRVIWTSMAIVSLLACVGCGGDDKKESKVSVNTGLDDSKVLNTLTPAELQTFCSGLGNADQTVFTKELSCKSGGWMAALQVFALAGTATPADADLQAACKTAYDACIQQTTTTPAPKTCAQPDATCTATVGEVESCYAVTLNTMQDTAKKMPSCDKITVQTFAPQDAGQDAGTTTTQPPAECTAFTTKCPAYATVAPIPTA